MLSFVEHIIDSLLDLHWCGYKFGRWLIARLVDTILTVCLGLTIFGALEKTWIMAVLGAFGTVFFGVLDWKLWKKRQQERIKEHEKSVSNN